MDGVKRVISIMGVCILGVFLSLIPATGFKLPARHVPWGGLDLLAPAGMFTSYKLVKFREEVKSCHSALRNAGVEFRAVTEPEKPASACLLRNRVVLERSLYPYRASVRGNCGLVAALFLWERQLKIAARHYLDSDIQRIDHMGIFNCRNVRGSPLRRSQHATATAIDISGFRLADGRQITVAKDWGKDTPEGRAGQGLSGVSRGVGAGL